MFAAVVTDVTTPPQYLEFPDPEVGAGQVEGTVLASAVHQIVRSIAAGRHYSDDTTTPFVPGVDGIVRLPDGRRVYTGGVTPPWGMLADRVSIRAGYAIEVPAELDDARAAALVNPATSSWVPLSRLLSPGGTVLVLGATGVSGRLAVQAARALGAGRVVAAGRTPSALEQTRALGADAVIDLADDLGPALATAADGYDVVLDYLWGEPARRTLAALAANRVDPARPVSFVNLGSLAGAEIATPAAVLRSAAITLSGHGIGSAPLDALPRAVGEIFAAAVAGRLDVDVDVHPLAEVSRVWDRPTRLVLIP